MPDFLGMRGRDVAFFPFFPRNLRDPLDAQTETVKMINDRSGKLIRTSSEEAVSKNIRIKSNEKKKRHV